jgi:hypothetical protein
MTTMSLFNRRARTGQILGSSGEGFLGSTSRKPPDLGQSPAEWWALRLILGAYAPLSRAATSPLSPVV